MRNPFFLLSVGTIFMLAGGLHIVRALFGWELIIEGFNIPVWLSVVVGLLATFLSYTSFRYMKRS